MSSWPIPHWEQCLSGVYQIPYAPEVCSRLAIAYTARHACSHAILDAMGAALSISPGGQHLHMGTGWFLAWVDGVEIVYMDRRMTTASMDQYLQVIETLMQNASWARPVLYDIPQPTALDARARKRLTELLNEHRETVSKNTLAYALSTPSTAVRGLLTAVFWVSPPPYPNKVFAEPEQAFSWLAEYAPQLNVTRTHLHYKALKAELLPQLSK